jgi:hypothetical protein
VSGFATLYPIYRAKGRIMPSWIKKFFRQKRNNDSHDPWVVYRTNRMDTQPEVNVKHFPFKDSLLSEGLYAYRLVFLVSEIDASRVKNVIENEFPLKTDKLYFTAELSNSQNLYIHAGIRREFNGAMVEMLTNNADLLNDLDNLELQTLPPWITFPDFDPDGFYCLQGNIEFWWSFFFVPFWESLDLDRKIFYLENAHDNWKELFLDRYMDMRS